MSQTKIILDKIIDTSIKADASYIHLEVGAKPIIRTAGKLATLESDFVVSEDFLNESASIVLPLEKQKQLNSKKSAVIVHSFESGARFRVNIFYQNKKLAMILNYIPNTMKSPQEIGITDQFIKLLSAEQGLIVVAGQHGSGKTATAISLLRYINQKQSKYILTLENPIEHILNPEKGIIEQRQIGQDASDFVSAIDLAKESDADVVFISDIDDYQSLTNIFDLISGGRLVIVVVEAISATSALEQIVNFAPDSESKKVRSILSKLLLGILIQQLVSRRGGGQITVTETLISNPAIKALIREGSYGQVVSVMQMSRSEGMRTLDQYLTELVNTGEVSYEDALSAAVDKDSFKFSTRR